MTTLRAQEPVRLDGAFDAEAVLALLRDAFRPMEGRIDPPSSINRLDPATLRAGAAAGELWAVLEGDRPVAAVMLTPMADCLYLGKLAVAGSHRGQGLARRLVETAAGRARARGLKRLLAQSRIELVEVHAAFRSMGFRQIGTTCHPGYARPTSVTLARPVDPIGAAGGAAGREGERE